MGERKGVVFIVAVVNIAIGISASWVMMMEIKPSAIPNGIIRAISSVFATIIVMAGRIGRPITFAVALRSYDGGSGGGGSLASSIVFLFSVSWHGKGLCLVDWLVDCLSFTVRFRPRFVAFPAVVLGRGFKRKPKTKIAPRLWVWVVNMYMNLVVLCSFHDMEKNGSIFRWKRREGRGGEQRRMGFQEVGGGVGIFLETEKGRK